jgi:hypothetical protein
MKTKKFFVSIFMVIFFMFCLQVEAFDIIEIINPTITQNPVEVVIWVKEGVTPANESRVLDQIRQGLDMWQAVPTASLAFNIVQVIHSATQPAKQPHQLMIIVGNVADLTSGGASFPHAGGNPGTWFGAVADNPNMNLPLVAAHEVGHAVGFHHTTISNEFPPGNYPLMHWAIAGQQGTLTQDDIAAVSIAYPNPSMPLHLSTGTIRGRLVVKGTTIPVSGVNVAAVSQTSGVPIVARLSGPRLTTFPVNQADGEFKLTGLPPGLYEVRYLDGHSFRGMVAMVKLPSDGITNNGLRAGYQTDNFSTFSSSNISVAANQVVNLGNIQLTLNPMTFDGLLEGELNLNSNYNTPPGEVLPNGSVGTPYNIWLHIAGGLRDIMAQSIGIPAGLTGTISGDTRLWNSGIHGNHFFRIQGTPTIPGHKTISITLLDAMGTIRTFAFNLSIEPLPGPGLVARYHFNGNTNDSSGNNYHAVNFGAQFVKDRNGNPNSALYFDGVNDYLELPHEEAFDMPEFTIIAILKLHGGGPKDGWIISKGTHYGNFTLLRRGTAGHWKGYGSYVHQSLKGNWSSLASDKKLPGGKFFCLAVSMSHSTFKAFVNGQLVRQVGNPAVPHYNDSPVRVGAGGYYGLSDFFKGTIDELAIYRGVLPDNTIKNLCQ